MCFSAAASFATAAATGVAGSASMARANRLERPLAAIPLIFAFQQAVEGLQWVVAASGQTSLALGYAFSLFVIFWPAYIPFVIGRLETRPRRKRMLRAFFLFGAALSAVFLLGLVVLPLSISTASGNVVYHFPVSVPAFVAATVLYVTAVAGSMLASSERFFRIFGLLVAVALAVSIVAYVEAFGSVWCFSAAVLSIGIYWRIKHGRGKNGR